MMEKFERDEGLRHFHRGVALERVNRIVEAVEEYRQAVARYPYLREAHVALGFHYQRNGMLAKAAEAFHTVANLEGDFLSYFNLGHILLELGRYNAALDAFAHCQALVPNDPATHYEMARACFLQGEFQRALTALQEPLKRYPDDWEVLSLIGRCHLELQHYNEAHDWLHNALWLSGSQRATDDIQHWLDIVERYREFDTPPTSDRDHLYARHGTICLGSAQDDGMQVEHAEHYHFTYTDIATTLTRLSALAIACRWPIDAVVAADRLATPLAIAVSRMLVRPLRFFSELEPQHTALVVLANARNAELMHLNEACVPGTALSFCLGVNWLRHGRDVLPHICGLVVEHECSVPWEATLHNLVARGASSDDMIDLWHDTLSQLFDALIALPDDPTLSQQTDYYTQQHRRLRAATRPANTPDVPQ